MTNRVQTLFRVSDLKNPRRKRRSKLTDRMFFFGKFARVPFEDVPDWYLEFALREFKNISDASRNRIQFVLKQRDAGIQPQSEHNREFRQIVS